jgi:Tol biopolymer transport system component
MYLIDATRKEARARSLFSDAEWRLHADCDISADGSKVLVTLSAEHAPDRHRLSVVDVATGKIETIVELDWLIDHAHFSPFDESWIVFANAEPRNYDRLWVWNQAQAPRGKTLFRQQRSDGKVFTIGHERAMFTERAALVIAFGSNSTARPCGLYEAAFDGKVRLVSESMRDFHCNVSQDGRWAVVSLQGMHDALMQRVSRNWLTEGGPGYGFSDVMIVNLQNGARQFLYRATNATQGQPYEVQPAISPDGKWVLLKDAREKRVLCIEIDHDALAAFLGSGRATE